MSKGTKIGMLIVTALGALIVFVVAILTEKTVTGSLLAAVLTAFLIMVMFKITFVTNPAQAEVEKAYRVPQPPVPGKEVTHYSAQQMIDRDMLVRLLVSKKFEVAMVGRPVGNFRLLGTENNIVYSFKVSDIEVVT